MELATFLKTQLNERLNSFFDSVRNGINRFRDSLLRAHPQQRIHSLKFEISILFTFVMGVILVIFCGVLYIILASTLYSELDQKLSQKAQGIGQVIRAYIDVHGQEEKIFQYAVEKSVAEGSSAGRKWWMVGFERRWHELIGELDLNEEYVHLMSWDGEPILGSQNMNPELAELFRRSFHRPKKDQPNFKHVDYQGQRLRVINYPFEYDGNFQNVIQVGVFPEPIIQLLQNWLGSVWISIPVILMLTIFVGYLMASRILDPVRKITTTARTIAHKNLGTRVKPDYTYTELNHLADAFNEMIDRLENSFHYIEEFSSQVAHELKTPLTIIRGETELALLGEKSLPKYEHAMEVSLQEINRMLITIESLMYLSKLEYQPEIFQFKEVEFQTFIRDIFEQSRFLAKDKQIRMSLHVPDRTVCIRADETHLRRLFFNLIDNAIKFTPEQGQVNLTAAIKDRTLVTAVSDNGRGISQENMSRIYEKFFREDHQRQGNGLGLSISQSIARIHDGRITADSKLGQGSTFTVYLPIV